ncbi:hypothetical protein [Marilutibacter chinensis]|uniref:Uncharacterized protein n=1 Tax=Marilutibacter chinensis TaxID=2912247 RepID=A0ABS9HX09_9GAMM|nr:hypothetical protein [Lysobacter chinensis]MCF7223420.1 hypothetical protein [Lysobacter chinensis]
MNKAWVLALTALLMLPGLALAAPKCAPDTFTGEKACVYGTDTIGMAGVGNQILTKDGKMYYRKLIMTNGDPLNIDALLFRLDDQRTIRLVASNTNTPTVDCINRHLCTWSWTVMAPISAEDLTALSQAKKLIVAAEDKNHRRTEESTMKKGGMIFQKFLDDIRANEPAVLAPLPAVADPSTAQ